jgi:hypothetical protein
MIKKMDKRLVNRLKKVIILTQDRMDNMLKDYEYTLGARKCAAEIHNMSVVVDTILDHLEEGE